MPSHSVSNKPVPKSSAVPEMQSSSEIQRLVVPFEYMSQRLDMVAASLFPDYSRARLQEWIKQGMLQVDGNTAKPRQKLVGGESLTLTAQMEPQGDWLPEAIALNVVYSDEQIIIINKPADMVVHPAVGNPTGTLLNGLLNAYPELIDLPRAGIVHRLDKDTTGLMVVARTLQSHASLVSQLQERTMGREYRALVEGVMTSSGKIDAPMGRHPQQRKKMAVLKNGGKTAVTHYRIKERFPNHTYLQLKLETGRTHQIRVHMTHLGHPLVGDQTYGHRLKQRKGQSEALLQLTKEFPRQALHAWRLSLNHPDSGEPMDWTADLPEDFEQLLEGFRQDARGQVSLGN